MTQRPRTSIADIFNMISARGLTFGAFLAFICNYILTQLGWNEDTNFGGAFDGLDPATAKTLLTAAAAVIGVVLDKLPDVKEWIIQLLSQSNVLPPAEIKSRLDVIETKVDAIKNVTDNLKTHDD